MNPILDDIYREKKVYDADGEPRDAFPAAIFHEDGMALYRTARDAKHTKTLEIGMAYGTSTLFLCQALEENGGGRHVVIDPYQSAWWEDIGRLNVQRAGYEEYVEFHEERSFLVLPRLLADGRKLDLAFIDGNHRFEHAFLDFFYVDRMLDVGGHVVLHDSWMPSLRKVLSYILLNRGDCYELVPEYMKKPTSLPGGCWQFLRAVAKNPSDLAPARVFARKRFHNFMLLRKTAHLSDLECDRQWEHYRAF